MATELNPVMFYATDDELKLIQSAQDEPLKRGQKARTQSNAVRVMLGWPEMRRKPRGGERATPEPVRVEGGVYVSGGRPGGAAGEFS